MAFLFCLQRKLVSVKVPFVYQPPFLVEAYGYTGFPIKDARLIIFSNSIFAQQKEYIDNNFNTIQYIYFFYLTYFDFTIINNSAMFTWSSNQYAYYGNIYPPRALFVKKTEVLISYLANQSVIQLLIACGGKNNQIKSGDLEPQLPYFKGQRENLQTIPVSHSVNLQCKSSFRTIVLLNDI